MQQSVKDSVINQLKQIKVLAAATTTTTTSTSKTAAKSK